MGHLFPTTHGADDPSESNLELANRLIERLSPEDRGELREMISKKGSFGGGLVTLMVVFWWLVSTFCDR